MYKSIFLIVSVQTIASLTATKNVVETTHGRISGRTFKTLFQEKRYHAFIGIPYASPPIKDLRFKAPQHLDQWDGVLSATKLKPACVQFNTNILKAPFGQYGLEDCLYLDIFTPAIDNLQRPVVVFIYSDRFQNSYNKTKDYAPDFFIEEDIIVVTISHRLSVFGFLSFEDETLPGNAGLKDIVAGLDWISKNIETFGGNPEKITLLGSQGGAVAVDLLIRSKARKLFHSAILQSDTSLNPAYLQENVRERAFRLGELLEIPTSNSAKLLRELNEWPSSKLLDEELRASPNDYYKESQRGVLTFGPIVENDPGGLVTEYPENSFENINIPIMIGFNSREGLASSLKYLSEPHWLKMVQKDFPFLMPLRLKFKFDPYYDAYYDAVDDIKNFYFKKGVVTVKSGSEYITYIGDIKSYAIDKMTQIYSNLSSSSVYYYHFDYYSDLNENKMDLLKLSEVEDGTWGSATGDELCYILRCPNLNDKYTKHKQYYTEVRKIQEKMLKMWANFIKYGNPTPTEDSTLDGIIWPPYDLQTKQYLNIAKEISVQKDLFMKRFKFWDDFIIKWEKKAENDVCIFPTMAPSRTCFLILAIFCINEVISDVIVDTTSGKLSGLEVKSIFPNETYYSFLGIPYALPPIGNLRFKPPVPHPGWNDIFEAKKERKTCAQYYLPERSVKQYGFTGTEDCLHLSVHTPKLPQKEDLKLPVIVYIYNELFRMSYNATKEYGNDFFMKEDVLVVTMNYRLGFLGFGAFEDDVLPGNNGIRDVILALKWVKDNIKNFGGDPSKITLMGNKGGAVIVDILLQSPKGKGLFSAAILQSDSSWDPLYIDTAPKKRAIALAEELKQKATTSHTLIQRLADISAFQMTEAELLSVDADEARAMQRGMVQFGPVVEIEHDEAILTKLPEENQIKLSVPLMIGFNSREALEMTERYLHKPSFLTYADRDFVFEFPRRVKYHFKINNNIYYKAVDEIKDYYFDEGYVKISKPGEYMNYIGDISSFYPMDYTVRKYTNTSDTPIYYYMFDYDGELNFRKKRILEEALSLDGTWGASVGDDLCYLFVCQPWRKTYKKLLENDDSDEIKVLRTMVKLFTNFAKTGNPTPPGSDFIWKPASKENRECLIISEELKMQSKMYEDKVKFWDDFIERYEKLAVDGVIKDIKDEL